MRTTETPIKVVECTRLKYQHFKGKKVYCKGIVALYPSLSNNFIQGVCDTCGFLKCEKIN